jgi:hypothetical protein
VKIKDAFWKPKITTNAEVTIPFEVQKLTDSGARKRFGGGVLSYRLASFVTGPKVTVVLSNGVCTYA